jgi:hypothetical protein
MINRDDFKKKLKIKKTPKNGLFCFEKLKYLNFQKKKKIF